MGLWGQFVDGIRNGAEQSIECKTCGSTYSGTIDRDFPYAICGTCLEREQGARARNGDKKMVRTIERELVRRRSTF